MVKPQATKNQEYTVDQIEDTMLLHGLIHMSSALKLLHHKKDHPSIPAEILLRIIVKHDQL
jgi:hypothetical protein